VNAPLVRGAAAAPAPPRRRLRALFVSDLHLGYKGADIAALNRLIASCEIEHLYLVGDILDGWKLEKRWHWTQDYCDFIDLLMALRRRRVRITLVTGNHDEKLREIVPMLMRPLMLRRFGIRIEDRCTHRTARGERLVVIHGDQFDGLLWRGSSKMADRLWAWVTERGFASPARPWQRWSLGRAIAREGGSLAERYAAAALRHARREDADGIVFGHSHIPLLDQRETCLLANCGAWTKPRDGHHTAVAEGPDGALELLHLPASPPRQDAPQAVDVAPPLRVRSADSARLIRLIHALWRTSDALAEPSKRPALPAVPKPAPPEPVMAPPRGAAA
jgi:UDP-2,3-diacylglucosamine pyrophosphatase LpxH